jgi:hypothetical protein
MPVLKTIDYRDGVMTFRIPSHWNEEYGVEGGGEFYDPKDEDRIFRLSVMTFEADSPKPLEGARASLAALAEKFGGEVVELGNGYYFTSHERRFEENGEALTNRFFLLSRMITDTGSHLASFSYTYRDSVADDPKTIAELNLLEGSVSTARFYEIENPNGRTRRGATTR